MTWKRRNSGLVEESVRSALTLAITAIALFHAGGGQADAATLSRSVDVQARPAAVWALIGPYCAIADWHPAIGTCLEDGKSPPTRTLVTRDGSAVFVERQLSRNDAQHRYAYAFTSSPLPVNRYAATIQVTAKGGGVSTVTWSGDYTPVRGKEKDAQDALAGIYESGLAAIKARLAR